MSNNFYTDDIQTGRNVYVDKDLYESDESYKARIDSYVKEGFALIFGTPDNPSSGGGGSDGYLGLHTATVNITYDTTEISGDITAFQSLRGEIYTEDGQAITFTYGPSGIPVAELGEVTQMLIPVTDGYYTYFQPYNLKLLSGGDGVQANEITVVSGDATVDEYYDVSITGDCSLNVKVIYQD